MTNSAAAVQLLTSLASQSSPGSFGAFLGAMVFELEDGPVVVHTHADGASISAERPEGAPSVRLEAAALRRYLEGKDDVLVGFRRGNFPFDTKDEESIKFGMCVLRKLVEVGRLGDLHGTPLEHAYRKLGFLEYRTTIPAPSARTLYDLVREVKPRRTLEVGLAYGLSTIAITQALRDNAEGSHVSIDPFQESYFKGAGLQNVAEAKLDHLVTHIAEPDYLALPKLLESGERFQMAFIDGNHMVDYTHLDIFYADRLLDPGGVLVLDDVHLADVDDVVRFMVEMRRDSYEPLPERSTDRCTVFRKLCEDTRTELQVGQRMSTGRRV